MKARRMSGCYYYYYPDQGDHFLHKNCQNFGGSSSRTDPDSVSELIKPDQDPTSLKSSRSANNPDPQHWKDRIVSKGSQIDIVYLG